jgi:hypothetical protein
VNAGGPVKPIGLLKDAHLVATGGAVLVRTSGNEIPGEAARTYKLDPTIDLATHPKAGFQETGGSKYRITREELFTPQSQYDATDPDFQNAMERSVKYLHSIAANGGGGGFYKGSQRLFCPAGKFQMHAPLEFNHNLIWEGEGSANGSPEAFGVTCFQWPDGTDFVRIQGAGTHDKSLTDVAAHDGVGGMVMRHLMLAGAASATVAPNHAIVQRSIAHFDDIYIRGAQGIGIRGWTGNVDGVNYGGNISTSSYTNVKAERCQGTMSFRGTDSNVLLTQNCQGYQNLQFGLFDGNAAGSNVHDVWHCTYNGIPTPAAGPFTQTSYMGNIYTPNIQSYDFGNDAAMVIALAANPPSGTTDHNAYWCYAFPGGPSASAPAWASGGPFIWGGDYFAVSPWQILFNMCYSEGGGGVSQSLYRQPLFVGGTLDIIGGTRLTSTDDAYEIVRQGAANVIAKFRTQYGGGSFAIQRDGQLNPIWYVSSAEAGPSTYWTNSRHNFGVQSGGYVPVLGIDYFGLDLNAGKAFSINGVPVLSGQMARIADLAAAPTAADFNGLLAAMIAKNLMHA